MGCFSHTILAKDRRLNFANGALRLSAVVVGKSTVNLYILPILKPLENLNKEDS